VAQHQCTTVKGRRNGELQFEFGAPSSMRLEIATCCHDHEMTTATAARQIMPTTARTSTTATEFADDAATENGRL